MIITIPIKREHIRAASMVTADCCAVALAIREAVPLADYVFVGIEKAHLLHIDPNDLHAYRLTIPKRTQRFIKALMACPRLLRFLFRERTSELDVPDKFVAKEPVRSLSAKLQKEAA